MAPNEEKALNRLKASAKKLNTKVRKLLPKVDAGEYITKDDISDQLQIIQELWQKVDQDYDHLEVEFPDNEPVLDEDGQPTLTVREQEYQTAESLYRRLEKTFKIALRALEAVEDVGAPVDVDKALQTAPVKMKRDRLVEDLKHRLEIAQMNLVDIPESEATTDLELLFQQVEELSAMWQRADDLAAEISQLDPAMKDQCQLDTAALEEEIKLPLRNLRDGIHTKFAKNKGLRDAASLTATRAASAPSSPVTSTSPNTFFLDNSAGGLGLERLKYPKFSGKMADYPTWKEDWNLLVHAKLSEPTEILKLRESVPEEARVELVTMRTLLEVWQFLDLEYGQVDKLAEEQINFLHTFQVPKTATTDGARFKELHRVWRKVYTTLDKIKAAAHLDSPLAINAFVRKFPASSRQSYARLKSDPAMASKKLGEIMNAFMILERKEKVELENLEVQASSKPSGSDYSNDRTCKLCNKAGHMARLCPKKQQTKKTHHTSGADGGADGVAKCTLCNQSHSNSAKKNQPVRLHTCPVFLAMGLKERAEKVRDLQGCVLCLEIGTHQVDMCWLKQRQERNIQCPVQGCSKFHHKLLHGSNVHYCNTIIVSATSRVHQTRARQSPKRGSRNRVDAPPELQGSAPSRLEVEEVEGVHAIIPVQRVDVNLEVKSIVAFFDSGSNINIVRTGWAKSAGLQGFPVVRMVYTTGGKGTEWKTMLYKIPLMKNNGDIVNVIAMGLDQVTEDMQKINHEPAGKLFPMIDSDKLTRPWGPVDLLVGIQMAEIHPVVKDQDRHKVGNLRLLTSQFGSGYLLDGAHEDIHAQGGQLCNTAFAYSRGRVIEQVEPEVNKMPQRSVTNFCTSRWSFLEAEELGVGQPRRCNNCSNCSRCSVRSREMTTREQAELKLIEANIKLDESEGKVTFKYPVIGNLAKLEDNKQQAIAIEAKVEARLKKKGQLEEYNEEMRGYLERGTFREIGEEEMAAWDGPINYIAHHGVPKPASKTTRVRIVSNSSLANRNNVSYNDLLPKGPNSLIPLLEALATWRQYPRVVTWDYSKCYNSVHTTEEELHCRRFVWRFEEDQPWQVYGINKMHFGDRPAAIGLDVAKRLVARAGENIDAAAARMIERDYVDDGNGGGTDADVRRLMGEELDDDGKIVFRGTVPTIMARGGFTIKYMIRDGEDRQEVLDNFGGAVLGIPWDTATDTIRMRFMVNLTPKVQKVRQGLAMKPEQVEQLEAVKLTKRIMCSQIYSIYDPLGLVSPITIKYKLVLQKMVSLKVGWDDELPEDLQEQSKAVLKEMILAGEVVFPRAVMGEDADFDKIQLLGFADGGKPASAACVYVRTKRSELGECGETHDVRLLASKARVTPSSTKEGRLRDSTPRTELRGLLYLARLITGLLEGLPYKPASIFIGLDSECIISAMEAQDKVLEIWFANRVAEIQDHLDSWKRKGIEVEAIHHWPGLGNIADLATKGKATVNDIGPGSSWQCGPRETSYPRESWPASRSFRKILPEAEVKLAYTTKVLRQPERGLVDNREDAPPGSHGKDLEEEEQETPPGATSRRCLAGSGGAQAQVNVEDDKDNDDKDNDEKEKMLMNGTNSYSPHARLRNIVYRILDYSNNLNVCVRILARVTAGADARTRETIRLQPTVERLAIARRIIDIISALEVTEHLAKLQSIDPFLKDGVWVTRGRMRKGLPHVFGMLELQVLLPDQRLAQLIMDAAHRENHDGSATTLARSRSKAWIHRGRDLARKVVKACIFCRMAKAKLAEQKMGQLPLERIQPGCPPFNNIGLDLLGPMKVKAMTNKRAQMKVWPIIFVCQATGAIHLEVMHDYGTEAFLLQWRHYTAVRGKPSIVVSDKGSQLTSGTNVIAMAKEDPANWDWDRISEEGTRAGVEWKFVPAGCQFRNGQSERMIQVVKRTLDHLLANTIIGEKPTLDYAELQVILAEVANITNDRPIGVRNLTEEDLVPLTVNHLLLGRVSTQKPAYDLKGELVNLEGLKHYHQELIRTWWAMWKEQGFPRLFAFNTNDQAKEKEDLKVGDICLLQYKDKVSAHYRLCMVVDTIKSDDGVVRTVKVSLRNRRAKKNRDLPAEEIEVAIQRLVLVQPAGQLKL